MPKAFLSLVRFGILAWVIPLVVSYIVYFGYVSNISSQFSLQDYVALFETNVFKYRVLGSQLLYFFNELIPAIGLPTFAPELILKANSTADPQFYSAFFYLNTLVLCLTASIFYALAARIERENTRMSVEVLTMLYVGVLALSQYIVVPYDMLSHLFLAAAIYCIWYLPAGVLRVLSLGLIMVGATLTRETSAVILAFYAAWNYQALLKAPLKDTFRWGPRLELAYLTVLFLVVYIGLRVVLGTEDAVFNRNRLAVNFSENFSLLGGLFFVSTIVLALIYGEKRWRATLFLLASSPYWIFIFFISNPREIRILLPVLIPLMLIQLRENPNRSIPQPGIE